MHGVWTSLLLAAKAAKPGVPITGSYWLNVHDAFTWIKVSPSKWSVSRQFLIQQSLNHPMLAFLLVCSLPLPLAPARTSQQRQRGAKFWVQPNAELGPIGFMKTLHGTRSKRIKNAAEQIGAPFCFAVRTWRQRRLDHKGQGGLQAPLALRAGVAEPWA